MARPAVPQFLTKGRLLAGAIFPRFVDTWNWLVRAFDTFAGDGDLNPQGCITVDRTNADRPVIRFNPNNLPIRSGGGSITADASFRVITQIGYDTSTGYIWTKERPVTVVDGVVTAFGAEETTDNKIATVEHSAE